MKRRAFLRASATLGGGLLLGFSLPGATQDKVTQAKVTKDKVTQDKAAPATAVAPGAFIRIDADGTVTLLMPKVEMGQGIYTAIAMLIAEELEVDLAWVRLEHAPPNEALYRDPLLASQMTGGSTSIRYAWEPMRRAGATARTMLVTAAARRWRVDPATCRAEQGVVMHAASGRRAGYGQLAAAAAQLPVPQQVSLKPPAQFRLIGRNIKRIDSRDKVQGTARFGLDVRLPGMLYAAIVQSPVFGGKLAAVDDTAAKQVPGVRGVVRIDNAVAVIAEHTWAAKSGAAALVLEWHEGRGASYSTEAVVRELKAAARGPAGVARNDGDVARAMAGAARRIDAVYEQPFLAHAPMEPVNCTVAVRGDACELWVGTQVPTRAVALAASITGLPPERIVLHNFLLGGGFGRRLEVDFIGQAVRIGRLVAGPVKVFWTREQDIGQDMYRPYYYDTIGAGLDRAGRPVAWQHRITGSSIMARFAPPLYSKGVDADAIEVAAELPYRLPNQRIEFARQEPGAVPTAFWRGVGPGRSTFVVESFIDELAYAAGVDPVRYRLGLLADAGGDGGSDAARSRGVLEMAAAASGWSGPAAKGRGRGVALMHAFGTFVALVAEASVGDDGTVRIHRVTCAVDCGMVVNPDTVEAQIEGGIMFGITAALYGEITVRDGRVEQSNFHDYRMLRIDQAPPVQVLLVKSSAAPGGIGEPGTAVLPPALLNALHAATGKRLRKLPVGDQLKPA